MDVNDPIIFEIDHDTLGIVVCSLRYLRDHFDTPGAIDKARVMASRTDVTGVVAQLESYLYRSDPITIILSRDDWSIYTHIVGYTCRILPRDKVADADVLEDLFSHYSDWENAGFPRA